MTDTKKPPVQGCSDRFTMFEPVTATNPPKESENWPVVEMQVVGRFTMLDPIEADPPPLDPAVADFVQQLAERVAAAPEGEQAALLQRIEREIQRRVSVLTTPVRGR